MAAPRKYPQELRERAIRLARESDRPLAHIARDLGIHPEALRTWYRQDEADRGERTEQTSTAEREELKRLRVENRELRQANQSASTVYARRSRPPSRRSLRDEEILCEINEVRIGHAACYGARRTWVELRRRQVQVARCTVERIMRSQGLVGVQRGRKAPRTTTTDAAAVRPPDLVNRNFTATAPDQLWLSDITYVPTWEGFVYVAFVTDAFSRRIVGWQTADHLRTDLPLDALEMALWNRRVRSGQTIHHSDAGSQYTSIRYTTRLSDVGVMPSVGTVADSYDNAMAEAVNGTFKAELIERCGPWKTRAQTEIAIYEWISWYNHTRLHSSIGDMPPAEYELNHYTQNNILTPAGAR